MCGRKFRSNEDTCEMKSEIRIEENLGTGNVREVRPTKSTDLLQTSVNILQINYDWVHIGF